MTRVMLSIFADFSPPEIELYFGLFGEMPPLTGSRMRAVTFQSRRLSAESCATNTANLSIWPFDRRSNTMRKPKGFEAFDKLARLIVHSHKANGRDSDDNELHYSSRELKWAEDVEFIENSR